MWISFLPSIKTNLPLGPVVVVSHCPVATSIKRYCEGDFYSSKDQVMNVFLIVEMCGVSLGQRQSWIASQAHSK